jgi:hypothetical protein
MIGDGESCRLERCPVLTELTVSPIDCLPSESLPILHAALPVWYRGNLVGLVANGEVFTLGWVEPRERPVVRALALAALEAPSFTPQQQLGFAAYYLLPDERWHDLSWLPDDVIATTTGLPLDVILYRRTLPSLDLAPSARPAIACA